MNPTISSAPPLPAIGSPAGIRVRFPSYWGGLVLVVGLLLSVGWGATLAWAVVKLTLY